MDESEKRVLRRRKTYLAECVKLDDNLMFAIKMADLLSDAQFKQVDSESSNTSKLSRLVECLCSSPHPQTFRTFSAVLRARHPAAAKNMEADLRMEAGQVKVDDDNYREAGLLVHRKFGSSKRVSEGEKRGMQDLIAKKLQIMKEESRAETSALSAELVTERDRTNKTQNTATLLLQQLRDFTKEHRTHLVTHAHDMVTTRETLNDAVNKDLDLLGKYSQDHGVFLERLSHVFTHLAALEHERDRCLDLLKSRDKNASLAGVLSRRLGLAGLAVPAGPPGLAVPAGEGEVSQERVLQRQRTKISDLEEQLTQYEAKIQELGAKVGEDGVVKAEP